MENDAFSIPVTAVEQRGESLQAKFIHIKFQLSDLQILYLYSLKSAGKVWAAERKQFPCNLASGFKVTYVTPKKPLMSPSLNPPSPPHFHNIQWDLQVIKGIFFLKIPNAQYH